MPNMIVYYVIYFQKLISCYLIKEGYIPCDQYKENLDDELYGAYSRAQFCIKDPSDKDDIFENKEEAKKVLEDRIKSKFREELEYLIEKRNYNLKRMNEV